MKTFRVFISSTFTDFSLERNILHTQVFPKIKKLCAEKGCEFQAVDLRWGITDRDSRDYSTLDICLEELRQCQRVTPRPNFIFLSGSKYGWRPLPLKIPSKLFKTLLTAMKDTEEIRLLKGAYQQDNNSETNEYIFVGIPKGSTEYSLFQILRRAAETAEKKRHGIFRRRHLLTEEERFILFSSATHRELMERLSLPDFRNSAICAIRTLKNVPDAQRPLFYDILPDSKEIDQEGLKEAVSIGEKAARLCSDIYHYELDLSVEDPSAALQGFADYVYEKMEEHILGELKNKGGNLEEEIKYHRERMEDHVRLFRGRAESLRKAMQYMQGGKGKVLLVNGPSACGKSAFMAKLASKMEESGYRVCCRFVGLTGDSADIGKLSEELQQELAVTKSSEEGAAAAKNSLRNGYGEKENNWHKTVIFLDGIEKARNPLAFLRQALKFAEQVECVVLSAREESLASVKELIPGDLPVISLGAMTAAEIREILSAHLKDASRQLTSAQEDSLIHVYEQDPDMHVFRTLIKKALKWKSFDDADVTTKDLAVSVWHGNDKIPPLLARHLRLYLAAARDGLSSAELLGALSRDREVLEEFLRSSMHVLPGAEQAFECFAQKNGIQVGSTTESLRRIHSLKDLSGLLDALLSLPREVLLPYAYYSRALYDFMPVLGERLSHGQRVYTIEQELPADMTEADGEDMRIFHSRLADYFVFSHQAGSLGKLSFRLMMALGITDKSRVAWELPYQYLKAERYDDLYALLCDPDWLTFMYRWDRAELSSLWTELQKHSTYSIGEGYAPLLRQAKTVANEESTGGELRYQTVEALIWLMDAWGGYQREVDILTAAQVKISSAEDPDLQLQASAQKALTMIDAGRFKEAIEYTEDLMAQTPEGKTFGYCDLLYVHGVALYRTERYPEANDIICRGYELAKELGESSRINILLKWKASCEKVLGNTEEAERIYRQLEEQFEQKEDRESLIVSYYERASNVFLFEQDYEKAFGLLEKAAGYAKDIGRRTWLLQIYGLGKNMSSVKRDYPKFKMYSLHYLDVWADVNPHQRVPDSDLVDYFISLAMTDPTAEAMFLTETGALMMACGPVRGEADCIREHPYRNILILLGQKCLDLMPKELRRIVEGITPAPEVFIEAFDKGAEKYTEGRSESGLASFKQFLEIFELAARQELDGEPPTDIDDNGQMISRKKILKMRTTTGFLLLYYGFDPISKIYKAAGAQQAEFMVQIHMILFDNNYTQFRNTMSYNEYSRRIRNHTIENDRFKQYRKESEEMLAGESELVQSLINKFSGS